MAQYLLPCECGRKLTITKADAGERLPCECGRTVDVPTLREIQSLETVAAAAPGPVRRAWGKRQGLLFLGASLVVGAIVAGASLFILKPPTEAEIFKEVKDATHVDVDKLTPAGAWLQWNVVREGLLRRPTELEFGAVQYVHFNRVSWHYWTYIAAGIGGLGIVMSLIGLMIPQRKPQRRVAKPPAPA
jgi:hypothetical protein